MLDKRDLIAQSQSGTGKTGTFLIGSIPLVDVDLMQPQVLVLCPNRELAKQIMYNFDALNIPPEHPARQEFDTFYVEKLLMEQIIP